MRVLAFMIGFIGVVGAASAGDVSSSLFDSDATAGRLMFETRFGDTHGAAVQHSFQLQFGSDRQFRTGVVPFRAEYRSNTGQVLLNGLDLKPMLFSRQTEEGGLAGAWAGWLPLAIVLTGITFIVVDGRDNGVTSFLGSGSGG